VWLKKVAEALKGHKITDHCFEPEHPIDDGVTTQGDMTHKHMGTV